MMASDLSRALHLVGDARALQRKLNCLSGLAADRPMVLEVMLHGRKHDFTFPAGELRDRVRDELVEVVTQLDKLGIELDQQHDQALPVMVSLPARLVEAPTLPTAAEQAKAWPPGNSDAGYNMAVSAQAPAAEEVPECPACHATTRKPCGRRDCGVLALAREAA